MARNRFRADDVAKGAFRQAVRTVHLWAGLILCLPIIVIGLSGSALLLQREILRLSAPSASAAGESQSIARMVDAAETAVSPGLRANWIELPAARGVPASVQFVVANRPPRTIEILVDPVSLDVLGNSEMVRRGPIMAVLVNIHEFLMMPPHLGLPAVGWTAVAMTVIGLSGLVLWWPKKGRWLGAFLVRRGAKGLRLHLDLHHAAGIWGLPIFLILSISGIYLAFPQTVSSAIRMALPSGANHVEREVDQSPRAAPADPDEAVARARSAMPNARVTGLQLPGRSGAPYVVQMETIGFAPSIPPIMVTFDSGNADSIAIDDPRNYPLADRVLNWQYALHFSVGMGWFWEFLVFLSGLLPLLMAITGITIWWKTRRARQSLARAPVGEPSGVMAEAGSREAV